MAASLPVALRALIKHTCHRCAMTAPRLNALLHEDAWLSVIFSGFEEGTSPELGLQWCGITLCADNFGPF
jgi:hypothetical protein